LQPQLHFMKSLIKYCTTLFCFWLLLFFINRIFFICYQFPIGLRIAKKEDLYKAIYAGYKLDVSTSAILVGLPLLLALLFYFFQKKIIKQILIVLVSILIFGYNLTAIGDAGIYHEWNAKINVQALAHFQHPSEVLKTISWQLFIIGLLVFTLFNVPFYYLYKKKVHHILTHEPLAFSSKHLIKGLIFLLISAGVIVILIRGGITNIPINQSVAYFSNDVLANDIAINPLYNILQDLTIKSNIPDATIYKTRTNEDAQKIIADDFVTKNDSFPRILNTSRPNLVYLFLESWSADNVGILGGIKNCTPSFDKLSEEGILFKNAYGQAYVSDQGIPAILSAYPSVSRIAIINQPNKVPHLPCITDELLPQGYEASFMFGGDLVYGNLRGYLLEKKFKQLVEDKDLPQYPKGELGIHDEFMFQELLKNLNEKKHQPFLQCFFTTSTHMPYDYEIQKNDWQSVATDPEKKYTEATHYSDKQLGIFFEKAKQQAWYKNTLFVVVADHSHNSIKQWDASSAMRQKIPMLLVGGALQAQWKGKQWQKIVSQLDMNATILSQMNLNTDQYGWSRNMFQSNTPSSAYYVFFGGIGYVNENGFVASQLNNMKHPITKITDTMLTNRMLQKGISFQQLVYEDVRLRK
jgi:phosphoglycerol transferase MdoB-like AlkP superfamily enzyme